MNWKGKGRFMKKYKRILMLALLFFSPILYRILFDKGEKWDMNTLDKNKKMW